MTPGPKRGLKPDYLRVVDRRSSVHPSFYFQKQSCRLLGNLCKDLRQCTTSVPLLGCNFPRFARTALRARVSLKPAKWWCDADDLMAASRPRDNGWLWAPTGDARFMTWCDSRHFILNVNKDDVWLEEDDGPWAYRGSDDTAWVKTCWRWCHSSL